MSMNNPRYAPRHIIYSYILLTNKDIITSMVNEEVIIIFQETCELKFLMQYKL